MVWRVVFRVGDTVTKTVYREGQKSKVSWVLPERPLLPGDIPNECAAAFPPLP